MECRGISHKALPWSSLIRRSGAAFRILVLLREQSLPSRLATRNDSPSAFASIAFRKRLYRADMRLSLLVIPAQAGIQF
jgi:hypothetical protein